VAATELLAPSSTLSAAGDVLKLLLTSIVASSRRWPWFLALSAGWSAADTSIVLPAMAVALRATEHALRPASLTVATFVVTNRSVCFSLGRSVCC